MQKGLLQAAAMWVNSCGSWQGLQEGKEGDKKKTLRRGGILQSWSRLRTALRNEKDKIRACRVFRCWGECVRELQKHGGGAQLHAGALAGAPSLAPPASR